MKRKIPIRIQKAHYVKTLSVLRDTVVFGIEDFGVAVIAEIMQSGQEVHVCLALFNRQKALDVFEYENLRASLFDYAIVLPNEIAAISSRARSLSRDRKAAAYKYAYLSAIPRSV